MRVVRRFVLLCVTFWVQASSCSPTTPSPLTNEEDVVPIGLLLRKPRDLIDPGPPDDTKVPLVQDSFNVDQWEYVPWTEVQSLVTAPKASKFVFVRETNSESKTNKSRAEVTSKKMGTFVQDVLARVGLTEQNSSRLKGPNLDQLVPQSQQFGQGDSLSFFNLGSFLFHITTPMPVPPCGTRKFKPVGPSGLSSSTVTQSKSTKGPESKGALVPSANRLKSNKSFFNFKSNFAKARTQSTKMDKTWNEVDPTSDEELQGKGHDSTSPKTRLSSSNSITPRRSQGITPSLDSGKKSTAKPINVITVPTAESPLPEEKFDIDFNNYQELPDEPVTLANQMTHADDFNTLELGPSRVISEQKFLFSWRTTKKSTESSAQANEAGSTTRPRHEDNLPEHTDYRSGQQYDQIQKVFNNIVSSGKSSSTTKTTISSSVAPEESEDTEVFNSNELVESSSSAGDASKDPLPWPSKPTMPAMTSVPESEPMDRLNLDELNSAPQLVEPSTWLQNLSPEMINQFLRKASTSSLSSSSPTSNDNVPNPGVGTIDFETLETLMLGKIENFTLPGVTEDPKPKSLVLSVMKNTPEITTSSNFWLDNAQDSNGSHNQFESQVTSSSSNDDYNDYLKEIKEIKENLKILFSQKAQADSGNGMQPTKRFSLKSMDQTSDLQQALLNLLKVLGKSQWDSKDKRTVIKKTSGMPPVVPFKMIETTKMWMDTYPNYYLQKVVKGQGTSPVPQSLKPTGSRLGRRSFSFSNLFQDNNNSGQNQIESSPVGTTVHVGFITFTDSPPRPSPTTQSRPSSTQPTHRPSGSTQSPSTSSPELIQLNNASWAQVLDAMRKLINTPSYNDSPKTNINLTQIQLTTSPPKNLKSEPTEESQSGDQLIFPKPDPDSQITYIENENVFIVCPDSLNERQLESLVHDLQKSAKS